MKVLIVGNGGREHALCWKAAQSQHVEKIYIAKGNAGTAQEQKTENIDIDPTDLPALIEFAKTHQIELTLVGPEAPLALGITDQFTAAGLKCFGPTKNAAQLEWSKGFCKEFMARHNIPTARFETFSKAEDALAYLQHQTFPLVIKADGLAAGKGVVIAEDFQQASIAVNAMLRDQQFGEASTRIVIEEFLQGEELSYIVMVDGANVLPLASSQDHKRRDDGDAGPNTGGMGAYSPAPLLTEKLNQHILDTVILPTVKGLKQEGTPYIGFLYAGLMISNQGDVKVLEFNCRLGDPETQPILLRLKSDLIELCQHALTQSLNKAKATWDPRPALAVVLAAGGYPGEYRKGDLITGLKPSNHASCKVFHAGTRLKKDKVVTHGGRVLTIAALGNTLEDAATQAYRLAKEITWPNQFYRHDIGHRALSKN